MNCSDVVMRLNGSEAVADDPVRRRLESEARTNSRRTWAALMLARDVDTCESVLIGRPVLAGRLDGVFLHRALRGRPLPAADDYIEITAEMADAVAEAGAIPPATTKGGKRR